VGKSERLKALLAKLAAAEEEFLAGEFLAPVVGRGGVRVRVAGVVLRLRVEPADFEGWGVFRPLSTTQARLVRPAGLAERKRYLDLFPLVRLILAGRDGPRWLAIPAHRGDARLRIEGRVPVRLIDEGELFEVVRARFDGGEFWYESAEQRGDPGAARYLREALAAMVEPDRLDRPGLSAEQRTAYALSYVPRLEAQIQAARDQVEDRLREALTHAGARLVEYRERRDGYRVTYLVGGQRHVSSIDKQDLTVQAAGICLSGEDRKFDLASLVGVLRQGANQGDLYRVEEGE